jgi:hypothetical protein
MKKKPRLSRHELWSLCYSHLLGHQFTLPAYDSNGDDDIRLSHLVLESAIRRYIDADLDAVGVANGIRDAADQLDAHRASDFELAGWNAVEDHIEIADAHLMLEAAITVRRKKQSDMGVANWLRDAADLLQAQKPTSAWLVNR